MQNLKLDGWENARRWKNTAEWMLAVCIFLIIVIALLSAYILSENWRVGWKLRQARAEYDAKTKTMQGIIDQSAKTRCPTNVIKHLIVLGGIEK